MRSARPTAPYAAVHAPQLVDLLELARRVVTGSDADRRQVEQLAIGILRLESDLHEEHSMLEREQDARSTAAVELEATRSELARARAELATRTRERDEARSLLLDRKFDLTARAVVGQSFAAASAELDRQVGADPPLPMLFAEDCEDTIVVAAPPHEAVPAAVASDGASRWPTWVTKAARVLALGRDGR